MAAAPKILTQSFPTNTTLTDIYTVPAGKSTVVSNIYVCNTSASNRLFRIAIAVGGAVLNNKQYIHFDETVEGSETFEVGTLQLSAGDIIRARTDSGSSIAFTVTGIETTP